MKLLDGMARDGSRSALAVVLKAARSRDPALRAIALGSLALAIADSKALERVLFGLKDPVRDVRSAALRAVVGVRVKDVITALVEYLGRERESRLRVDALKLLMSLTGHNMGLIGGDWKKWWRHEKSSFEFPKEGAAEVTSVRAHDLSYFGIEVSSKRIAFLIDVSLSMLPVTKTSKKKGGSIRKLDLMKRELTSVLRKLAPEARVNIFGFDRAVRSWEKKLRPLSGSGRGDAIKYVRDIGTGGGTNIFDSVELSLADSEVDTIYLLTDGMPTTGRFSTPEGILRGTREINRPRAVTIHCIAFGADSDLLKKLAADHGGQYRFVDE